MKPIEVNDVLLAFPASVSHLLPDYKTIPEKFKAKNPWSNVFNKLFFGGKGISFIPKEDIDPSLAWRHIRCVMGSYEPKHEHKEAGCCYLFDCFFQDAIEDFQSKPGEYKSLITGEMVTITDKKDE